MEDRDDNMVKLMWNCQSPLLTALRSHIHTELVTLTANALVQTIPRMDANVLSLIILAFHVCN